MEEIGFRVGAKAARLIGRENIADVDGALIELIKNAYDADATCVYVEFQIPFPDVPERINMIRCKELLSDEDMELIFHCYERFSDDWRKRDDISRDDQQRLRDMLFSYNRIIVADNGSGMPLSIVKSEWMYIGTNNKERNIQSAKGRIKTGAKGIGRFALDKLSLKSCMFTKAEASNKVVEWRVNWEQFNEVKLIDDVKAELGECSKEYLDCVKQVIGEIPEVFFDHNWTTGTTIVLNPLREAWSQRLFEKVNTNLKSINPIGSADTFIVVVNNTWYPEYSFVTKKVAIDEDDYDYRICARYDGAKKLEIRLLRNEVNLAKKSIVVEKYGKVVRKSTDDFWEREKFQRHNYRKEDYDKEIVFEKDVRSILPQESLEKIQEVGPFTSEMFFLRNTNSSDYAIMKRVAVRKRRRLLEQFSGIKLYRDDFKVRPYGDEGAMYDWLEMGLRKQKNPGGVAHQTGAWRVQPYQMIGLVKIGRETNPSLIDMANREGLALNETYYIFVDLLQDCLKEFEFDRQYVYREYSKWIKSIEDELGEVAERVKEKARESNESKNGEIKKKIDSDQGSNGKDSEFSEQEMLDTVYDLMKESEHELNSKQILQALSASGILLNTFFHEFNAINTQFHVQASQIRSRVNYILDGEEYTGLSAYNPYNRIKSLEENDLLTAAFLDVIMEGLKKDSLRVHNISFHKMVHEILKQWEIMLRKKHIRLVINEEDFDHDDIVSIAAVDVYIILNNFILNSAWFLEQGYNDHREITISISCSNEEVVLGMENNGPALDERYQKNPDKIFELGESSKGDKGTGLGLWIMRETVERNDGSISVMEKNEGFGLIVRLKKRG